MSLHLTFPEIKMKSIITFLSLIFLCNLSAQTQSVLSLGMKLSAYQDWLYVSEVTPGDPAAKAGVLCERLHNPN